MTNLTYPDDFIDKIICGDAEEILLDMPKDSVDIVVTSPPYNQLGGTRSRAKGWSTNEGMYKGNTWHKRVSNGEGYPDDMPENEYQKWITRIFTFCMSNSKGLVWVNHKTRYRDGVGIHPLRFLPFPLWAEVVWQRNGSMALNCKRFAPSHEYIFGFGRPHYWNDDLNTLLSVWQIAAAQDKEHPCTWPAQIPQRLIVASCPPGGIVLDPFMGVGKTAIAAIRAGCHYIGIDSNEEYCEIAKQRIRQERSQLKLNLTGGGA